VTSRRKLAKDLARWEADTRAWATDAARQLALALYHEQDTTARPFRTGVVLDPGERVWVETPLYFSHEIPPGPAHTKIAGPGRALPRPWLVTDCRVIARLGDERLHGWRWEHIVGCRVDLTPARETVVLDIDAQRPLIWSGPAVAPLAIAAVFRLYGPQAMIEHPGLALLRSPSAQRTESIP
jgi:hypothetical protein